MVDQLAQLLQSPLSPTPHVFVGFDGFTDEIVQVVDQRQDPDHFLPMTSIAQLGDRISKASGQSTNLELVPIQKKIGGNGPIFCEALLNHGVTASLAGAMGSPDALEPLFQPLAEQCLRVYPLCPSGHSDALEFGDGKLILGKLAQVSSIDYPLLMEVMGQANLRKELQQADLVATCNWTMLPGMTGIWEGIRRDLFPQLEARKPRPILFVDLADPAKRSDQDLTAAMKELGQWTGHFEVVLGLNRAEASRLLSLAGSLPPASDSWLPSCELLCQTFNMNQVVVHTTTHAYSWGSRGQEEVQGPYTPNPKLTTGAGDVFNAGFCAGLLRGLDLAQALALGVFNSGFYVRRARSPTPSELIDFLMVEK